MGRFLYLTDMNQNEDRPTTASVDFQCLA